MVLLKIFAGRNGASTLSRVAAEAALGAQFGVFGVRLPRLRLGGLKGSSDGGHADFAIKPLETIAGIPRRLSGAESLILILHGSVLAGFGMATGVCVGGASGGAVNRTLRI